MKETERKEKLSSIHPALVYAGFSCAVLEMTLDAYFHSILRIFIS
jgi:hypothetical protein